MKSNLLLAGLLLLFMACGSKEVSEKSNTLSSAVPIGHTPTEEVTEISAPKAQHQKWDGFYFYDIYMGSIIVIHEGKYYNFARKEFKSFYKDFEYDIDFELNEDGFIPIVRKYYLDRNDQLQSKETILFDTQPVEEGGKTTSLQCRGYDYQPLGSFGAYLDAISTTRSAVVADLKANSKHQDDSVIETALNDPDFVAKSGMTEAPLRGEAIAFWQLLANIIEAK
ncbi:MAG: hypothetical protein KTR30_30225 [Saprospiraceae bacterium]|nr:hypothetical protein [Saprospiraceae bacterium]